MKPSEAKIEGVRWEFEARMQQMGILEGAMTFRNPQGMPYYHNDHIQWMWMQFKRKKGIVE